MTRPEDLFSLAGKAAIVTGAGRGLGRAIALGLAKAGADVAIVARTGDQLTALQHEITGLGRRCSSHVFDVSEASRAVELVADVVSEQGRIDILVNNAGVKIPQPVLEVTEEAWDEVMGTNARGAFFIAQAVSRHMVSREGRGKIINIASTYAVVGAAGRATYAASKAALWQLTKVMAIELAPLGINVNAVGPTSIATPMNAGLFADEKWRDSALTNIPAGRFPEPEDVIGAVIFLASAASDMVHGHLLLVDGGLTAR